MLGTPVETLKELNLTAQKAAGVINRVHFFRPEGEPAHVYLIATTNTLAGQESVDIERHEAAPPPRVSALQSVRSVPEAIETLRQQLPDGAPAPIVWYSEGGITVELDRRQRIHYEWSISKVAGQVQSLPAKFEPKNLRKWLRVAIGVDSWGAGCQQLYDALAVLKFNVNRETRTQVGNGRESLGRDLDARVGSDGGTLPE
ncbi:MAG: hypothetical protein NT069_08245, partial [Planctomycetota bacterium]|nr:hypothetical protein [Planctomycetota bacterium]